LRICKKHCWKILPVQIIDQFSKSLDHGICAKIWTQNIHRKIFHFEK